MITALGYQPVRANQDLGAMMITARIEGRYCTTLVYC
jgi:hypothetical protein